MPLEATQHTARGAQAFAEFFIKTIDWGYATTSSKYMRHYYASSCIGCTSTAIALDKAAKAKHHFIGDRFTVKSIKLLEPQQHSSTTLLATFDVNSSEVVDKHNHFVDGGPALTNFQERVDLVWTTGAWRVFGFTAQR